MKQSKVTVAKYLQLRLQELGLEYLFGVAGNYTAPFLNTIIEDSNATIKIIGHTNEINAGYCADGYARLKGFSAVAVTFGVGAYSLLSPIAGSYVEHCPVLVINGAPTNSDQAKNIGLGLLASHMTGDMYSNINVYRTVTVAAEQIMQSSDAPYKIDTVLNACILYGRPAYLEVFEDVWRMECSMPEGSIITKRAKGCIENTNQAAKEVKQLISKYQKPIFWAGIEIQRYGLQKDFLELVEATQIEFTTSLLGKSIVSEDHPLFRGVFNGNASPKDIKERFEKAGVKIGIGAWTTGKNLGGFDIWSENAVLANMNNVRVGSKFIPNASLKDFINALKNELNKIRYEPYKMFENEISKSQFVAAVNYKEEKTPLNFNIFFKTINDFLNGDYIVVSDAGFPLLGAQGIHIAEQDGFVAQASWLAIGYSVAAATGVKLARPDKRIVVFVGDGAFQETCQSISTQNQLNHNTIVFILDNGIYGIEQMLINPNPFRGQYKVQYNQPDLNDVYSYNNLHQWKYSKLTEVFGGVGFEITYLHELNEVLRKLNSISENVIVHVHLPKNDIPEAIAYKNNKAGEDETIYPGGWSLC